MNIMNQILTANVASSLYWLGRYLERVEETLLEIDKTYDCIIDSNFDAGKILYEQLGVELQYKSPSEFIYQAILGDHEANLIMLLGYARENAIISRIHLDQEAFGSIIQLHNLFIQLSNGERNPDFIFMDEALSLISEIWGELTRRQTRNVDDYFLKLGKYVEKVDFHLRVGKSKEYAIRMKDEIDEIVYVLSPRARIISYRIKDSVETILEVINSKFSVIVTE